MTFAVSASLAVLSLLRHAAVPPAQTLAVRPQSVQSSRITVRAATRSELQAWRDSASIFGPLSELCAECLFSPASEDEIAQLSQEMHRNLIDRFSALNNRRHVLLLAEDARGAIVGSCGVEASPLTPEGRATPRLPTDLARMDMRPLLSNMVVAPEHRRRGVAKRLMREAEAHARGWGFEELLLKVEAGNEPAELLYRALGYQVAAEDRFAEKPEPGVFGVRWVPTLNVCLRKDLVEPSVQNALSAVPILRGL